MVKVIARHAAAAAIFGVLTIGSFVSAQAAQPARELPSVTVRYADLDLNTAGGVDALYGRLRAAARAVCDVRAGRPLVEANAALACYRQVLAAAVDNVKSPTLSAVHRTRNAHSDLS